MIKSPVARVEVQLAIKEVRSLTLPSNTFSIATKATQLANCEAATFGQECPSTGILPIAGQIVNKMSTDTVKFTLSWLRRIS
jgi:hypothetical protein